MPLPVLPTVKPEAKPVPVKGAVKIRWCRCSRPMYASHHSEVHRAEAAQGVQEVLQVEKSNRPPPVDQNIGGMTVCKLFAKRTV